ncbi:hypothetical protein LO762_00085 [Actinocorallia sp. API 0066]|nr:hypothetical protein [Actinocorallia sp. API 0066]MCD0447602.1 hypothetical protein [Actinocorallia sp. API 0066]
MREDGEVASPGWDRKQMSRICGELERRFGLSVVAGRVTGGMPSISRAETARVRDGLRPEPERLTLARHVRAAALVAELTAGGALVRARRASGSRAVTGYAVALPPPEGKAPAWFGGGHLAPDLTLPRLRERWLTTLPGLDVAVCKDPWD